MGKELLASVTTDCYTFSRFPSKLHSTNILNAMFTRTWAKMLGHLTFFFLCIVQVSFPANADDEPLLSKLQKLYGSTVLDNLEEKFDRLTPDSVAKSAPELVRLLERREPALDWRVLRVLSRSKLGSLKDPEKLIESVARCLDHSDQAIRSLGVGVLVSIGEPAVKQTQKLLESESPRVRACGTEALRRLKRLPEAKAITLSLDADPRVRVASIQALGESSSGVKALIAMLNDNEIAVSCRAAERLGRLPDKPDTELIVTALENALLLPDVSVAALEALARMGTDARSAIPSMLSISPISTESPVFGFDDLVEMFVEHIGPPRPEDIPTIAKILERDDPAQRSVVCRTLAKAGKAAVHASEALILSMETDLELYRKKSEAVRDSDEERKDDGFNNYLAASEALRAYWFVTRDIDGFMEQLGKFDSSNTANLQEEFWSMVDSQSDKVALIERLLTSIDLNQIEEALIGIDNSQSMTIFEPQVFSLLQSGKIANQRLIAPAWLNTLDTDEPDTEERVLSALKDGKISIKQFTAHAVRLGLRSEASLEILLDGVRTLKQYEAQDCADAYLQLVDNHAEAIEKVLEFPEIQSDWIIGSAQIHKWHSADLLPIVEQKLPQMAAIEVAGNIGPPAVDMIPEIVQIFDEDLARDMDGRAERAMECAAAIFKIQSDATYIEKMIERISRLESNDSRPGVFYEYQFQELLRKVPVGTKSKFAGFIAERLKRQAPLVSDSLEMSHIAKIWMELAVSTGDKAARECVLEIAKSKDALFSKMARECLKNGR